MRDAQAAAANAGVNATNTGAGYGAGASTIGSQLVPFLSQQLTHPSGMSQQDIGSQLTAGLAGAGGATSGLQGAASKDAATSRNPMGFSAALDSAARSRDKAAAGTSEGIAANNVNVKLDQQNQAARGLQGLYGTDVGAQTSNQGQVAGDVNAETNAGNSGWLQNTMGILKTLGSLGK
jgi:hypothetical protein